MIHAVIIYPANCSITFTTSVANETLLMDMTCDYISINAQTTVRLQHWEQVLVAGACQEQKRQVACCSQSLPVGCRHGSSGLQLQVEQCNDQLMTKEQSLRMWTFAPPRPCKPPAASAPGGTSPVPCSCCMACCICIIACMF